MTHTSKYIKPGFLIGLALVAFVACKKDGDGSATVKPGNMVANAVTPNTAAGGELITLSGSGLSDIRTIVFEKDNVPATFNPTLNTGEHLVFRVPDTATGGPQNIILTNSKGRTATIEFNVNALPIVNSVSNYNFTEGTEITITGFHLAEVTSVKLKTSNQEVTIVSKSKKELVVRMPAATANTSPLDITNPSGTKTTTEEFVYLDNAYQIFTEGFRNGFENASWGPAEVTTEVAKSGTTAFKATWVKGNWWANGFASWSTGVPFSTDYKYLSFWVKGGSTELVFYLTTDQKGSGYGNSDRTTPLTIPAEVWTYFKLPLTTVKLWENGTPFKQLGLWIPGPDDQDETLYFDDVLLIK